MLSRLTINKPVDKQTSISTLGPHRQWRFGRVDGVLQIHLVGHCSRPAWTYSVLYRVLVQGYYSRGILPGTKRGLNAWHCLSLVQQTFLNLTRGLSQGGTTVLPASGTVSGPPDHHVLNKPEAQVKCLSSETEISSRRPCALLLLFRWPFQNNFAGLSGQWADFLS